MTIGELTDEQVEALLEDLQKVCEKHNVSFDIVDLEDDDIEMPSESVH